MADLKDPKKAPEQEDEKKQGLSSKQKMVLIILGIVLVCATVIIVIFLLRSKPEEDNLLGIPIVNEANVEDINREIDEKVAKGMFETHMNTTWRFPDGKSASSNAIMGNSPNNNFGFYFTVTLDTGETVYTSGLLPVGTQIAEIILETNLKAGTYPAVVGINMVDDEENPVESNMGVNITLVVEN